MPPPLIVDPSTLDFDNVIADIEAIQKVNAHRHEFQLLDAIVYCDTEQKVYAGYHDVRPDAWWARGHIPGRPLFPGVLMIECAAQLASYLSTTVLDLKGFLGFVAVDQVKFRGTVEPPARFVVVGKATELKRRRTVSLMQGFVENRFVFEAKITGMPI